MGCSTGTENRVRTITSMATWLVWASISTGRPSASAASRSVAATPASHMAEKVVLMRPPSKAGSMMRR